MHDNNEGDRSRLRLTPLTTVMPKLSAAESRQRRTREPADHRRTAEGLVELCAQVLRGRHPLAAVRRVASAVAFRQFAVLYRRLTHGRGGEPPVTMRLSRTDAGPSGAIDMVAIVQAGRRVRALTMRATRSPGSGWQLTLCQLVGRYLGP